MLIRRFCMTTCSPNMDAKNQSGEPTLTRYRTRKFLDQHSAEIGITNAQPIILLINLKSNDCNKTSPFYEHNYLRHFRQIYERKGWIVILATPTEDRIANGETKEIVTTLLECLENRRLHRCPIIMHILGHEGLPVHNAICQAIRDERELGSDFFNVRGCILDSCPNQPTGLLHIIKHKLPRIYDILIFIICLVRTFFPEFFSCGRKLDAFEEFCYQSGTWPQLFLYSNTDHIVSHHDIEKAISVRQAVGAKVTWRCWPDTEHARHLFVHEDEYTQLCQNFVLQCLQ